LPQENPVDPCREAVAPSSGTAAYSVLHTAAPRPGAAAENSGEGGHYTEVVGPGHAIVYMPLMVHQIDTTPSTHECSQQQQMSSCVLQNYKVFQKSSAVGTCTAPGIQQGVPCASLSSASANKMVPMFVYDASSSRPMASRVDEAELMLR
jgi:hypothetical protein